MTDAHTKASAFLTICPACSGLNRLQTDAPKEKKAKCGHCNTELDRTRSVHPLDFTSLQHVIKNSPVPVFCDFWAPWCNPCLAFAPVYQEAAVKNRSLALFVKLDTEAHPEAGSFFNIRGIPTLVHFNDGAETTRQSGALPPEMLLRWIQSTGFKDAQ
jgi:thioredoxin 2